MIMVINLFGGPGVGKSTIAASVFVELKKQGINCELITEFAKDKVWEESLKTLEDQIYVFGKQFHKMWRVKDKVDVIICDSPLVNSIIYDGENDNTFHKLIMEQFNKFANLNYLVGRNVKYEESGRSQTESEAKEVDNIVLHVLDENEISYKKIDVNDATNIIVEDILKNIKNNE